MTPLVGSLVFLLVALVHGCRDDVTCGENGICLDSKCRCADGWIGTTCEFECPGLVLTHLGNEVTCSDHGACVVVYDREGAGHAKCNCDDEYYGNDCGLTCPTKHGMECSGHGICVIDDDKPHCECSTFYTGDACETQLVTTAAPTSMEAASKSEKKAVFSNAASLAGGSLFVIVLAVAVAACALAERRKRQITRYQHLIHDVGTTSSSVLAGASSFDSSACDYTALKENIEMKPLKSSSSASAASSASKDNPSSESLQVRDDDLC